MRKRKILIEGWRFSHTSLAVLNMYQLIELLKDPDIELFHRDLPYYSDRFAQHPGLWPAADEARVAAIPAPGPDTRFDATLRIAVPMPIEPDPRAARTFVLGLAEYGIIEDVKCGGIPAAQALRTPGVQFITCSEFSRRGFLRSGADPDSVHVVHLGVDPAVMRPVDQGLRDRLRAARGWGDRFVVLNISTLMMNKGMGILLTGFARVAARYPQALLVIKGNDILNSSDQALQAAIAQLPPEMAASIAGRIEYMGGALGWEEIAALYQSADIYAAPYIAEGFNLPVLEAAACGTPSICTSNGPTDEFTTEDFCLRIPSETFSNAEIEQKLGRGARILLPDLDQFSELLAHAIEEDFWRAQAHQAGPEYVRARFSWTRTTQRLLKVLLQ